MVRLLIVKILAYDALSSTQEVEFPGVYYIRVYEGRD